MKALIKGIIKKCAIFVYHIWATILPVKNDMIVFESNVARNYTGNPRAVYEYMVSQGLDKKYRLIWVFENPGTKIPGNAKKVRRTRVKYFYYMAVSHIWIADCRQPMFLKKRKNQVYIQTWHGTPLKKLALDMEYIDMSGMRDIEEYRANFKANTSTWDYLISQNSFSTGTFRRCFDFHKEILEIGYPRNDVLFYGNHEEYIAALKEEMGLPPDKKIILYAPTWRDNQYYQKGMYKFATLMDYDRMMEALGDEYVMIVKYHYLVKDPMDWSKYKGFVYQFSQEEEISRLYLVSDLMITDYSSVMFDYSLLKRPMFFFAYDMEDYRENLRGFYFDFLNTAPGPIVETNEALIAAIRQYDSAQWQERYQAFSRLYNHADDGNASKHVCEVVSEKCRQHSSAGK